MRPHLQSAGEDSQKARVAFGSRPAHKKATAQAALPAYSDTLQAVVVQYTPCSQDNLWLAPFSDEAISQVLWVTHTPQALTMLVIS